LLVSLAPQEIASQQEDGQGRPRKKTDRGGSLDLTGSRSNQNCVCPGHAGKYASATTLRQSTHQMRYSDR